MDSIFILKYLFGQEQLQCDQLSALIIEKAYFTAVCVSFTASLHSLIETLKALLFLL